MVYGGNGSFNYSWSGPNGYSSTSSSIDSLEAGQYTVSIADLNGCVFDKAYTCLLYTSPSQ